MKDHHYGPVSGSTRPEANFSTLAKVDMAKYTGYKCKICLSSAKGK